MLMSKHFAAFGEVMMRLEVPNHALLAQANELRYSFSGSGVNVAAMLAHLDYQSSVITTLPNNALGKAAEAFINRLGISSNLIHWEGKYLGKYFLETGYGIRPSRVTYTNRLESSFNQAAVDLYNFNEIARQVDVVHLCGIALAMNDKVRKQMISLAKAVRSHGGLVVFDCNYRSSLWGEEGHVKARPFYEEILQLTDIAFMNEMDMIQTLGMKTEKTDRKEQLQELLPKVTEKFGPLCIAGTHRTVHEDNKNSLMGYLYKKNTLYLSEPKTFAVLDRIGAGDAFAGGIIYGALEGYSGKYMVDFATSASALAHTIVGDSPILTKGDILQAIAEHGRDVMR